MPHRRALALRGFVHLFALLVLISLLYWFTLHRGIGGRINYGDSVKWQYLWAVNGTPHSTGYPLFLAITKAFGELFVFLEPYKRITLASLLPGIFSLVPIYIITTYFTQNQFLRLAAPTFLAFSSTYWSQSTEPEVYTLSVFISSAGILLLLLFIESNKFGFLLASLLLYSLSLGNHLTAALLLPAYAYGIFSSPRKNQVFRIIILIAPLLALVSLGQYSYIYYLSHIGGRYLEYIGKDADLLRLIDYSTGGQFRGTFGASFSSIGLLLRQVVKMVHTFIKDLSLPMCLTAGYAIAYCSMLVIKIAAIKMRAWNSLDQERIDVLEIREKMRLVLFFASTTQILYALSYPIIDIETYYISIYAWIIPLSISFIDDFLRLADDFAFKNSVKLATYTIISLLLMTQLFHGYQFNKPKANNYESLAKEIFRSVPDSSFVFVDPSKVDYPLYVSLLYYSVFDESSRGIRVGRGESKETPDFYSITKKQDIYLIQRNFNGNSAGEARILGKLKSFF